MYTYELFRYEKNTDDPKRRKSTSLVKGTYQECIIKSREEDLSQVLELLILRDDGLMMNRISENEYTTFYGNLDSRQGFGFTELGKLYKDLLKKKGLMRLTCYDRGNDLRGYIEANITYGDKSVGIPTEKADYIIDAVLLALPSGFGQDIDKIHLRLGTSSDEDKPTRIRYWLSKKEDSTVLTVLSS